MKTNESYNGYKNYQTWNVALWINNDEHLYRALVEYAKKSMSKGKKPTYGGFIHHGHFQLWSRKTGDGVLYTDHRIAKRELNVALFEDLI